MHPDHSPLYYLANFQTVLDLVAARYPDLLNPDEQAFMARFARLPEEARALLVRLIMRSRDVFVAQTLCYDEIPNRTDALASLHEAGFVELDAAVSLDELFSLCTKPELLAGLAGEGLSARQSKPDMRLALEARRDERRTLSGWLATPERQAVRLNVRALADTCRLLFFGNLHQDWSEFVVTDLGHLRYESVEIPESARGFRHRAEVDASLMLHGLRHDLEAGEAIESLRSRLPEASDRVSAVVTARIDKFIFQLGQQAERNKDWPLARSLYAGCRYPSAPHRLMRVHEQLGDWSAAYALALDILQVPPSEEALQVTCRALPRLTRKLKLPMPPASPLLQPPVARLALAEAPPVCVEVSAAEALTQDHRVARYVENTLFSSLFGLVFWDAIFAAVPGAFFHPFQAGPADLFHPTFASRRSPQLAAGFASLASDMLADELVARWQRKQGLQTHFVFWPQLDEALIRLAVQCIPRECLRVIFERMLFDLKSHRSGFPDLIVFDTRHSCMELVEVKAPGDRVQDNQARWMDHFLRHGIPCRVLHVTWPTT